MFFGLPFTFNIRLLFDLHRKQGTKGIFLYEAYNFVGFLLIWRSKLCYARRIQPLGLICLVFIAVLSDKFGFPCRSASMLVCLAVDSGYILNIQEHHIFFFACCFLVCVSITIMPIRNLSSHLAPLHCSLRSQQRRLKRSSPTGHPSRRHHLKWSKLWVHQIPLWGAVKTCHAHRRSFTRLQIL